MTKLQRYEKAKRETLKAWHYDLLYQLGVDHKYGRCGFCDMYYDNHSGTGDTCHGCPIVAAEGEPCYDADWPDKNERGDGCIAFILAILCWLQSDDLKPLALESTDK